MTYAVAKAEQGRKPIRIVEIDFLKCALTYGVGVCQAGKVADDTAQAGNVAYIDLAAGDVQADDYYNDMVLKTTGGTGSGQEVTITDYVNSTNRASATFAPAPDATTTYTIHFVNSPTACYNARKNCQDSANFDGSDLLTVKLVEETTEHMHGINAIPVVTSVSPMSTTLAPGKRSTGNRAGLTISCSDFVHHDRGLDPYVANRIYTPVEQGTFFGKLKARNLYWPNSEVRLKTGYLQGGYDAANFTTRTFYLEKFNGPNKKGGVSFFCQDILRRLDNERATVPAITTGALNASYLSASTADFTVTGDSTLYDTGGGSVRINDEVITYTSGTVIAGDQFTFSGTIVRGVDGTGAEDHSSGDSVQNCVFFEDQTPYQISLALYDTYGGIPTANLDLAQWATIADKWLPQIYSRRITEPTGIKKLLAEAHEQMGYFTWWDEDSDKVKLEAVRPPDAGLADYTQSTNIIANSVEVEEKPDERITQVHVHYNARTPNEGDKPTHFTNSFNLVDVSAEGVDQYGDSRIKEIFARWITGGGQASTLSSRLLNRFRDGLRRVRFDMDAKDDDLKTGDQCYITVDASQDADGSQGRTLVLITQRDEIRPGEVYRYYAIQLYYSGRYGYVVPDVESVDYGSATDDQKNRLAWISPAGGNNFANGDPPYKVI